MITKANLKEELFNCVPEIFFDEWKYKQWVTIELVSPLTDFEIKTLKGNREYYLFTGIVLSKNPFRIIEGTKCRFFFSKGSLLKELKKYNETIQQMNNEDCIQMDICRINKKKLEIKNLERLTPQH